MGDTVTTQAMSFAKSFTMADSQPAVDESLTVTVVDGSNTTQVKVAPNGSVRDQVAYQAPAGKVFAGWFADQAYTTPLTWTRSPRTPPSTPSTSATPIWTWLTAALACSVSVASP